MLKRLLEWLKSLFGSATVRFSYRVGLETRKDTVMFAVQMTNEGKKKITLAPITLHGNPVTMDGPVTWTVQPGGGNASVTDISPDGLSAYIVSDSVPSKTPKVTRT
jgi:hypothetical protein